MNTILFLFTTGNLFFINVIDTVLEEHDCKSHAGRQFYDDPMITSACVINSQGKLVLDLAKNPITLECTKRISL